MKIKLALALALMLYSTPGFISGWPWPSRNADDNAKSVSQVIEAMKPAGKLQAGNFEKAIQSATDGNSPSGQTVASFELASQPLNLQQLKANPWKME